MLSTDFSQSKVFNVIVVSSMTPLEVLHNVNSLAQRVTNYHVETSFGLKKHRGKAIGLMELVSRVSALRFYKYMEYKDVVEIAKKLATFYVKPFSCDYAGYIGATFFNDMNPAVMGGSLSSDVFEALNDVVPYNLFFAKSGSWYCWGHLGMKQIDGVWTLVEIRKVEVTRRVKVEN